MTICVKTNQSLVWLLYIEGGDTGLFALYGSIALLRTLNALLFFGLIELLFFLNIAIGFTLAPDERRRALYTLEAYSIMAENPR